MLSKIKKLITKLNLKMLLLNFTFCSSLFSSVNFKILDEKNASIIIRFELDEYRIENIFINGKEYSQIFFDGGIPLLIDGFPDLPHISKSIIIPDDSKTALRIIEIQTETLIVAPVVPSKGNLKRNINPDTIPYKFDMIYNEDRFYPDNFFELSKEFILRDFRGITLKANPFRYNNIRKELIILRSAKIEI